MMRTNRSSPMPKKAATFFALCLGVVACLSGCALPTTNYQTPDQALSAASTAIQDDEQLDFISTMSRETLAKHAQKIEFGWSEIRERFAFLDGKAEILVDETLNPTWQSEAPEGIDSNYVWPSRNNAQAVRRLRIALNYEGKRYEEDLLFVQEIDEVEAGTAESPWIRVGEQWILRERHANPKRYSSASRTLEERKNWKLVYPYYPFHQNSALARKVLETLAQRG